MTRRSRPAPSIFSRLKTIHNRRKVNHVPRHSVSLSLISVLKRSSLLSLTSERLPREGRTPVSRFNWLSGHKTRRCTTFSVDENTTLDFVTRVHRGFSVDMVLYSDTWIRKGLVESILKGLSVTRNRVVSSSLTVTTKKWVWMTLSIGVFDSNSVRHTLPVSCLISLPVWSFIIRIYTDVWSLDTDGRKTDSINEYLV